MVMDTELSDLTTIIRNVGVDLMGNKLFTRKEILLGRAFKRAFVKADESTNHRYRRKSVGVASEHR